MQTDAFDGVFDDPKTGRRLKFMSGRLVAEVRRNALHRSPLAARLGMRGKWGTFPVPPITPSGSNTQ